MKYMSSCSTKIVMIIFKKIIFSLRADFNFIFFNKTSLLNRIFFIFNKYYSVFFNKRVVRYLGYDFFYDTRLSPQILQFYPNEICKLDKYVNFNKLNIILDVGANVGQWAFTAKYLFPHLKIYSFEPNIIPFLKLKKNASEFRNWKVFNYAIGRKPQIKPLYYAKNSTVGGSFYKEITGEFSSSESLKQIMAVVVYLNKLKLKQFKIPLKIDLVKIDVEGAELDVLESLIRLDFKYLVVEVPVKSKREVNIEKITDVIKSKLNKKANLLHLEPVGNLGIVADAIFELN